MRLWKNLDIFAEGTTFVVVACATLVFACFGEMKSAWKCEISSREYVLSQVLHEHASHARTVCSILFLLAASQDAVPRCSDFVQQADSSSVHGSNCCW